MNFSLALSSGLCCSFCCLFFCYLRRCTAEMCGWERQLRDEERNLGGFEAVTNDNRTGGIPCRCDRILSFGKAMRLLDYRRFELKLSDHRPVTAVFMAEVEVFCHRKLQRALTFTDAEVEEQLNSEADNEETAWV
ncbi:hypothetical protein GW17_00041207 [Ensete ventricosum]|nr:hypothetical protein GW17_00041207 [Ensete ventricosum]